MAMTDELRIELAELMGWTRYEGPGKYQLWLGPGSGVVEGLPSLSDLVTQAERGLTEEQLGKYALIICQDFQLMSNGIISYKRVGRAIISTTDDRAKALIQVLRG